MKWFTKNPLKTKTFWTTVVPGVATGIFVIVNGDLQTGIYTILGALGIMSGRDAIAKLEIR